MNTPNISEELGPLPKSDRNQALQQLSINALRQALPVEYFIIRDERERDAGVDLSIELLAPVYQTNLRSQVQMKATDQSTCNKDGSVSLQVTVRSLNYLLNGGPAPLYFLYVAPREELRFIWAREEKKRLDRETPDWLEQDQVTIRFSCVLGEPELDEIYKNIYRENKLARVVSDALGETTDKEINLRVDVSTHTVQDGSAIAKTLTDNGLDLVAVGQSAKILDLFDTLSSKQSKEPQLLTVRAYAEYTLGRYLDATAHISSASLQAEHLSDGDKSFLRFLKDGCDYQTGRIGADEYARRLKEQAGDANDLVALFVRLGYLRYEFLSAIENAVGDEARQLLLQQCRDIVVEINGNSEWPATAKLQAEVSLLFIEGADASFRLCDELTVFFLRSGDQVNLARIPLVIDDLTKELFERLDIAISRAKSFPTLWLLADALCAKASVRMLFLGNLKLLAVLGGALDPPADRFRAVEDDINIAIQIYSEDGNAEGVARSKMLLAQLVDMSGDKERAAALGQEILPLAEAMSFSNIQPFAQRMASGETRFGQAMEKARHSSQWSSDQTLVQYGPEEIDYMADRERIAKGLPLSELPVLTREWEQRCEGARQRLSAGLPSPDGR